MGGQRTKRQPRRLALGVTLLLARVLAVVGGGAGLALTDSTLLAPPAAAHNVAQGNTRVFLEPEDADLLLDRAEAGGGGIQAGDVLDYIIQFEPIDNGATTGVGGYVTFYPPSFTEVVGAAVVDHVGNDFVDIPVAEAGPINDGPGSRGSQTWGAPFAAAGQGSLAQLYGDTGIWYSTSPETAKYVGDGVDPDTTPLGDNGYVTDPTACNQLNDVGFCRAHNLWDHEMVDRFGDNSYVGRIVPSGRGNTPYGAGSPVAGPDTHYGQDWRAQVGPWTRVTYPGSQIGTGVAPVTDPGPVAPTAATAWLPTSAGVALDESNPDHDDITAVRWAVGRLTADPDSIDDLMWVRVQLRFTSPPTSCPVDAEVFGGDADIDDAGKDNMWRYYVPVPAFGAACLTLDKVGPAVVEPDGDITYTIRVGNITATPVTDVVLADALPAGTTFVAASDGGTVGGGVVTWPTIASLGPGETRNVTLTVQAPGTAGLTVTNEVTAVSDQTGLIADRWDTLMAANTADLVVTKTDGTDPVVQGEDLEYTVTVTNNGPSTAVGTIVTDDLPPGTTLVSATPSVGTCSGTGPLSCSVGDLAPGASATVAVVLDAAAPGTVTNTATATSTTPEAFPDDNTDDDQGAVEVGVEAAAGQQADVGAPLDEPAVVEHEDLVCSHDGRQPMGDHHRRPSPQRLVQSGLHRGLVLGVEVAGGLVEDDDAGVLEQHAGDGQALLLAARQPVAPLADQGVEPVGQGGDDVPDAGGPAGLLQLVVGDVGPGVTQVGAHGLVEEVRVLGDHADGPAQGVLGQVPHVVAVDAHRALGDLVEAGDEGGEGRLARARRADQGGHGAGGHDGGEALQHR